MQHPFVYLALLPQRSARLPLMSVPLGEHAIVIGAGIAGLGAAAALSPHFGKVTVLERDSLPVEVIPRSGVPQSNQLHGLLNGGLRALETLFPGFERDLAKAGAVHNIASLDLREEMPG